MSFSKYVLSFLYVFIFLGCSAQKGHLSSEDPLEKAYRKIDQNKYDEALADLIELEKNDPRAEVRQALASAYAARAGLKFQSYSKFIATFKAPVIQKETLNESQVLRQVRTLLNDSEVNSKTPRARELQKVVNSLATLELWVERLQTLPLVQGDSRIDLENALNALKNETHSGARLYRALIGLVAMKSDVSAGVENWKLAEVELLGGGMKATCKINLTGFAKWSVHIVQRLGETLEDLSISYPTKKAEFLEAKNQTNIIVSSARQVKDIACEK